LSFYLYVDVIKPVLVNYLLTSTVIC